MIVVLDCETSRLPNAYPYMEGSYLSVLGVYSKDRGFHAWTFHHKQNKFDRTEKEAITEIQETLDNATTLVAHNLKFDYHWLLHYGIKVPRRVYCTQVAEYLLNSQDGKPLGLDACCQRYGIPGKLDTLDTWYESGYNTHEIPLDELLAYLERDVVSTHQLFSRQQPRIKEQNKANTIMLSCAATLPLTEMEAAGWRLNERIAREQHQTHKEELESIDRRIFELSGRRFNITSDYDLSAALYGGNYKVPARCWYYRQLKAGPKLYSRREEVVKSMKGMGFEPLPGTELKAPILCYSTAKPILQQLKCKTKEQREMIDLLLRRSQIKKDMEFIWTETGKGILNKLHSGRLHTSFNQTVVRTTRLSSTPNLQNIPAHASDLRLAFESEYDDR